jgi:hypothetical protein
MSASRISIWMRSNRLVASFTCASPASMSCVPQALQVFGTDRLMQ